MRCGDVHKAEAILHSKTALDAKRLGSTVYETDNFQGERVIVMSEILQAKIKQVPEFLDTLKESESDSVFVEAYYDEFWGSGLDFEGTVHTVNEKWPGKNNLGIMLEKLAKTVRPNPEAWQTVTNNKSAPKSNANKNVVSQFDVCEMLIDLKTPRKRLVCGRRKSVSAGNSRTTSPEKSGSAG
ncbi:hypothetical protein FSP39_018494 [Pinctada imbricata]|uniref:NADAR domain-containing protein n=1 Tax=Pinctada imbricata TaxID=66713 RepID=A0AA88YM37_PINIB|nr:hypothetical protein FSP39_018494 [Pinctada imbricata]